MTTGDKMVIIEGWITTVEAVALTGYNVKHIRNLCRAGVVEGQKITPRAWLINRQSLLDYKANVKMGRPPWKVNGDE